MRAPPGRALFPYTTLFRSRVVDPIAIPASFLRQCRGHITLAYAGGTQHEDVFVVGYPGRLLGQGTNHAPVQSSLRSEEHTSELQSHHDLVCRLLLEKKKTP